MLANVRPIYLRGKSLPAKIRAAEPATRGVLKVFDDRLIELGRVVTCASLTSAGDGQDSALLPVLLDVQIIWLDGKSMRLRGNELVDGALFGQTWDVEVQKC